MAKTVCSITRKAFLGSATPLPVAIGKSKAVANPKHFSTGSVGYCLTGKMLLPVGKQRLAVQVGINVTVVGSKDLPTEQGLDGATVVGTIREDTTGGDTLASKQPFANGQAGSVMIAIAGTPFVAAPRVFSSGKVGWSATGKVNLMVNGQVVKCQVGVNLVGVGTETLPTTESTVSATVTTETQTITAADVATVPAELVAPAAPVTVVSPVIDRTMRAMEVAARNAKELAAHQKAQAQHEEGRQAKKAAKELVAV